jgi:peptidoglycan hydrolase-like protein with peptidoglycan-binding domain
MSQPRNVICHHTATPWTKANENNPAPTLNVIRDGHGALPGPLSHLYLDRDGVYHVVAAGLCNHVGTAAVGETNSVSIGIEAEASGTGDKRDWPEVQYDSYVTGVRALATHFGAAVKGHKEVALPKGRKSDPNFCMDSFRARVFAAVAPLSGKITAATTTARLGRNYTSRPVKDIQKLVGVAADGHYGPTTTAAVSIWQRENGLDPDGNWGPISDAKGFPKTTTKPAAKTVNQMAQEVIAGKHGTGHAARQKSLGVADSVYAQVKNEVARLLKK